MKFRDRKLKDVKRRERDISFGGSDVEVTSDDLTKESNKEGDSRYNAHMFRFPKDMGKYVSVNYLGKDNPIENEAYSGDNFAKMIDYIRNFETRPFTKRIVQIINDGNEILKEENPRKKFNELKEFVKVPWVNDFWNILNRKGDKNRYNPINFMQDLYAGKYKKKLSQLEDKDIDKLDKFGNDYILPMSKVLHSINKLIHDYHDYGSNVDVNTSEVEVTANEN